MAGILASILNNDVHPKHQIIQYEEWFASRIDKGDVVLDVGCNTGIMAEIMSCKASFVYGIDIENRNIEKARRLRQKNNIEYVCADATSFDYGACKEIDVVTLSNILEHIQERVVFLQKLIKQIKWRSKKRFLIRVPMIDREWIAVYKRDLGLDYRLDDTHYTEYTFEQFQAELEHAGIVIEDYQIRFGEIYAFCKANE